MKNTNKIVYWIFTGLLSALILTSATRYFLDIETFRGHFVSFGYNGRIVIPLAIAKILGVAIILSNKIQFLKEWAYAGFLFNFLLALEAHIATKDNLYFGPVIALVLLAGSYTFYRRAYMGKKDLS
ncbi:DoxX family protein [uncultured Psychroserpens sp.]|uniref:DoxX family protein n=1 Tax=uncultured Psychroserpens sp. TaxID=255436 RepID=UPI002637947A|nr:DoxX family protein [uncultured Psychroserpens sp.]